jgi:predicted transcriptional regulator of viral defense system
MRNPVSPSHSAHWPTARAVSLMIGRERYETLRKSGPMDFPLGRRATADVTSTPVMRARYITLAVPRCVRLRTQEVPTSWTYRLTKALESTKYTASPFQPRVDRPIHLYELSKPIRPRPTGSVLITSALSLPQGRRHQPTPRSVLRDHPTTLLEHFDCHRWTEVREFSLINLQITSRLMVETLGRCQLESCCKIREYRGYLGMISTNRAHLSSYLTGLLASGRAVFLRDEAVRDLGSSQGAFLDAAERLQRRGHLVNVRQGFYVAVPPQFLSWGAPPPSWYIDELMRYEGRPYYVGLLRAAELHGASHQAEMEFQVVTDKRMPELIVGRSRIVFSYRKDMEAVAAGIEERKTDTGRMKMSSVELTVLDLLRYPRAAGGIDQIATVLSDLAGKIEPEKLARLSASFERPVVQRLGHLLEHLGHGDRAVPMFERLRADRSPAWVELVRSEADFESEPIERDQRWRVVVRRVPEIDE